MSNKIKWCFFAFYMAIWGSFCGLEIDSYVQDLPFFQVSTLLIFLNASFILLLPILFYTLIMRIRPVKSGRIARISLLLLNSIYFHLMILLALYKAVRKIDFDLYLFWYNTTVALSVLWKLFAPWTIGIILSIAAFAVFQKPAFSPIVDFLKKPSRKPAYLFTGLILAGILCQLATINTIRGSAAGVVYANFLSDRQLRTDYREVYRNHIETLRSGEPAGIDQCDPSILGDAVFIVKMESLNDFMIRPNITPQLLRASQDGILFRHFYSNSIQSIRGYECILCGVPPNIAGALVDSYPASTLNDLNCLPGIFKDLGYRTLYFFGGSRNPRIKKFAESIGFERVLSDDIVRPTDVKFDWGYREDIFYTRVHEYIQKHFKGEKLFVFIDTGATNHAPFEVLDTSLLDDTPFPRPEKFEERLSNTTFVQDAYFGHLYDIYRKHYAHCSTLVAVSDHAWPIPRHKHNIYNERGAYEENFLITQLFIPPSSGRERFAIGGKVTDRFSQMDIYPSILDLIGMNHDHMLGESFASWLLSSRAEGPKEPQKSKLSIQPYGGGFVSVVQYPKKYLFDVLGGDVKIYDLEKDPEERSPTIRAPENFMYLIENFFRARGNSALNTAPPRQ